MDHLLAPLRRISLPKINASVLLLLAAVLAVIVANSPWNDLYHKFLNFPIDLRIGKYHVFGHHGEPMTLAQFVNDALMAVFFFVVGLEIKQELTVGELSSLKKSILPVIAAFGGMIVPVVCFYAIANTAPASEGAAIPMATDIAFALALIGALGSRVPASLRIFLMALAVVDDIGGIIVIALFYSSDIAVFPLLLGIGILGLLFVAGRLGVVRIAFYSILGFVVWSLFLHAGIHPTIAGVAVALCIPLATRVHILELHGLLTNHAAEIEQEGHKETNAALVLSHGQLHIAKRLKEVVGNAVSPVQKLEHELSPLVSYIILPLFAFVNAGVTFGGISSSEIMGVPLAIFLGLFVGKTVGITLFTTVAIKLKICSWPSGMTLHNLIPLSIFGGIGFTVSLFIANLSYSGPETAHLLNQAKLGIFAGTVVSAVCGYLLLGRVLGKSKPTEPDPNKTTIC